MDNNILMNSEEALLHTIQSSNVTLFTIPIDRIQRLFQEMQPEERITFRVEIESAILAILDKYE